MEATEATETAERKDGAEATEREEPPKGPSVERIPVHLERIGGVWRILLGFGTLLVLTFALVLMALLLLGLLAGD